MQFEFPVFENLCPAWARATHLGTRQVHPKGALLLGMEVPADGIFYIQQGQVDTLLYTLHGPEKLLYCVSKGCLFGEASCFSTGVTGEASVWARTPCVLYFFHRETVEGVIAREHPELLIEMIGMLGHIVRMYGISLRDSLSQDYFVRVCRILVYFVRWKLGPQPDTDNQVLIQSDVTQNDLAKLLGLHRVTVTKAVGRLKDMGIIRHFIKSELDIADYQALCRLGGLGKHSG
ncbi:MAG: Crp/Fnr family transcriptional regulator [Holophaga sp.]|nr:Crp/Fnr family transcriptional regulator [Holophaga sp.]